MNATTLTLAFSAGMAAAVNPCGFALLPAYLAYYVGLEPPDSDGDQSKPGVAGLSRAVLVGASMTGGFIVVFGIVGLFWSSISSTVGKHLPWVTFAIGLLLVVGGLATLAGRAPTLRLPKVQVGSSNRDLWSVFAFGVSYAIASLSCTIPIFVSLLGATFRRQSILSGAAAFGMYALGMGAIIIVLTIAVASARLGIVRLLRRAMPHMERISGAFMVVAGAFVAYYGWWEARVLTDPLHPGGLGNAIQDWQASISSWIQRTGELRIGIAAAIIIAAAVTIAMLWRRPRDA